MCPTKPFKTYEEQIALLRSRNLKISDDDKAKEILSQTNYYKLINGYKDLFIDDSDKNAESFIEGTSLEDVYALYNFDRRMRIIFLEYILIFEIRIKTLISYNFSELVQENDEKEPYLIKENFDYKNSPKNQSEWKKNSIIKNLINTIKQEINKSCEKKHPSIKHYKDKHDRIPLWVLMNILTFGNITFFYDAMKLSLREKIAKKHRINNENLNNRDFRTILKIINVYRNSCAHEERLYKLDSIYRIKYPNILKDIFPENIRDQKRLFSVVIGFFWMLKSSELTEFCEILSMEIDKLDNKLRINHIIKKQDVLNAMGFPENWEMVKNIKSTLENN